MTSSPQGYNQTNTPCPPKAIRYEFTSPTAFLISLSKLAKHFSIAGLKDPSKPEWPSFDDEGETGKLAGPVVETAKRKRLHEDLLKDGVIEGCMVRIISLEQSSSQSLALIRRTLSNRPSTITQMKSYPAYPHFSSRDASSPPSRSSQPHVCLLPPSNRSIMGCSTSS